MSYNTERPHHALGMAVPASRDRASPRPFPETVPETVPELVYDDDDEVRIVRGKGEVRFQGHRVFVSEGLTGEPVGIRPTLTDGLWTVHYGHHEVTTIDLRAAGQPR